MRFNVLTTGDKAVEKWHAVLGQLPPAVRDIHYLPEYGRVYEMTYGVRARLSVGVTDDAMVVVPFVLRSLDELPFLGDAPSGEGFVDAASAYGYGGPAWAAQSFGTACEAYRQCDARHLEYLRREGAASEFTCLHPLLANHRLLEACGLPVERRKQVVYVALAGAETDLWRGLNRGNRNSVNRARRMGVVVEKMDPTPTNLSLFNTMYYATMERVGATQRWFFPEDYFANCFQYLGPERCSLFCAKVKDEIASCFMLMHAFNVAYYHFAGTSVEYHDFRPNNLLMWEVMLWAKSKGYGVLHLGGGASDDMDDSLMQYKRSFSKATARCTPMAGWRTKGVTIGYAP